jgi:hypothetical protein
MTNNARVENVSRNCTMKHKQAVKAVEACACAWVEFGVKVRDLTIAESIAARNQQAKTIEPLAKSEQPGLVYRPAEANQAGHRVEMRLMRAANQFAAMQA